MQCVLGIENMSEVCPGCGEKGSFHADMQESGLEPTYILCTSEDCDVHEYETEKDYTEFENLDDYS
jgi:hypothetical protein